MSVADYFLQFCVVLRIGAEKRSSIASRTQAITRRLNLDFRLLNSESMNRFYGGSYGRGTGIVSVSDIDLIYELPASVYAQYNAYAGNGQSALLQAVKNSIAKTYPSTALGGDGQVVVIRFTDGIKYDVLPAFANQAGGYTFADTNNGGQWRACKPKQEIEEFSKRNRECNGNLVELSRMARAWKDKNSVPMSGMLIDTLAYQFIGTWPHRDKSYLYYDYLTRDFFAYLAALPEEQQYWLTPGSGSYAWKSGSFSYKARQAELRAREAIAHLVSGQNWSAKQKFIEIYGTSFPS